MQGHVIMESRKLNLKRMDSIICLDKIYTRGEGYEDVIEVIYSETFEITEEMIERDKN